MAYYEQKIMSAQPGETTNVDHLNPQIQIVKGTLDDSFINKAVTYDGPITDLSCPAVKLAELNEMVVGAIIGYSYGKLQIAVEGWDIKFIPGGHGYATQNTRIVGHISNDIPDVEDGTPGYIRTVLTPFNSYSSGHEERLYNGRGNVLRGNRYAGDIAYVSMIFGG